MIQTATGLWVDLLELDQDKILIEDIAHSLSQICRFNGHTGVFYSVAQHSVLVSQQFTDAKLARVGLMHDASEAYLGDVIRPIKNLLGKKYHTMETLVMEQIALKFDFGWPMPEAVRKADGDLLATEFRDIMGGQCPECTVYGIPLTEGIYPVSPEVAKVMFLERFDALFGQKEIDFGPEFRRAMEGYSLNVPNPPAHTKGRDAYLKEHGLEIKDGRIRERKSPSKVNDRGRSTKLSRGTKKSTIRGRRGPGTR